MKFDISARPVYHFNLTIDQVEVLRKCAQNHYDAVCNAAAIPGGYLWGWKNIIEAYTNPHSDLGAKPDDMHIQAQFRELDISLKILEMRSLPFLSDDERRIADEINRAFKAIVMRSDIYMKWELYGVEV